MNLVIYQLINAYEILLKQLYDNGRSFSDFRNDLLLKKKCEAICKTPSGKNAVTYTFIKNGKRYIYKTQSVHNKSKQMSIEFIGVR